MQIFTWTVKIGDFFSDNVSFSFSHNLCKNASSLIIIPRNKIQL